MLRCIDDGGVEEARSSILDRPVENSTCHQVFTAVPLWYPQLTNMDTFCIMCTLYMTTTLEVHGNMSLPMLYHSGRQSSCFRTQIQTQPLVT